MNKKINNAYSYIYSKYPKTIDTAIICGSGLGKLADEIQNPVIIDYKDIPHFPKTSVEGHEGKLIIGDLGSKTVVVMKGRYHYYEGHDEEILALPIRVFSKLEIENLIITNASGGISDELNPGQIALINDHISFLAPSPLRGPNLDEFGPRFKDMTEVYSKQLRNTARIAAKKVDIELKEGVYAFCKGPMYETPAEIRAFKALGADMVGMSTVPEAIVARHCGMNTLGISLVTNKAAGLSNNELSHNEVMEASKNSQENMIKLIKQVVMDM